VPVEGSTLVLPRVEPLGALPFIEPAMTTDHAIHSAPRRGQGPEYLGIREYRPGDSMRHVHWPSTARTGGPMVREFEQEQTRRLAIVLDVVRDAGNRWTPLDRVCCAAASLAMAALAEGHGARIVTASDEGTDVLSRADEDEILERLALIEPDAGADLASTLTELGPALRGVQTAVVVFPTWASNGPDVLPTALEVLAEQIPRVVAVPVVVAPAEASRGVLDEVSIAGLEQRMRAAGAAVYPWHPGETLAAAFGQERPTP
jgi:uncharacterized protein (DUF58 family)